MVIREIVRVQAEGGSSFEAQIALSVDKLDRSKMPTELRGTFTKLLLDSDEDRLGAELAIRTKSSHGGSSHTIWFHGRRTGYRFRMNSYSALGFVAEKV